MLVLDGLPQALDEDLIAPAVVAVNGDPDFVVFEHGHERQAGELVSPIRVEDLRSTVTAECLPQGIDAGVGHQHVRSLLGKDLSRSPVDDRQVPLDIRIHLVQGVLSAGVPIGVQRL